MGKTKGTFVAVMGLLLVFSLYMQPVQAARVQGINNASKKVYIVFDTSEWLPILGHFVATHVIYLDPSQTKVYEDLIKKIDGQIAVFIDGQGRPTCIDTDGAGRYYATIRVRDSGDKIACRFKY